jgi:hypothetical protein
VRKNFYVTCEKGLRFIEAIRRLPLNSNYTDPNLIAFPFRVFQTRLFCLLLRLERLRQGGELNTDVLEK